MNAARLAASGLFLVVAFAAAAGCQNAPITGAGGLSPADSSKARAESLRVASAVTRGSLVFAEHCAMCHGDGGNGDGEVAARLAGQGVKVARLNDADRIGTLTRDQIVQVITKGGEHTKRSKFMPSWAGTLTPGMISDLADFVQALPVINPAIPTATLRAFLAAPPGTPQDGRTLFVHHCVACHGPEGRGDGPFAVTLRASRQATVRNLTDSTYFATRTDAQLFATISLGGGHFKKSAMMPAWTQTLSPQQVRSIVSYVRSISRTASKSRT